MTEKKFVQQDIQDDCNVGLVMEWIFPYRVFRIYNFSKPDGSGPFQMLEAGFREKADAEQYVQMKGKMLETSNYRYVIERA